MNKAERIGIYGGTFDPIHRTHLEIARAAVRYADLDRVLFVVSANPPHKNGEVATDAEDRFRMVQLAIEGEADMEASRLEIDREGPSYTVDTLRQLQGAHPEAQLYFIIGQDSLEDMPGWRDPGGIVAMARLLVLPRPDSDPEPPPLLADRMDVIPFRESPLSSTAIRERLAQDKGVSDLLPPAVETYIREHRLYGTGN